MRRDPVDGVEKPSIELAEVVAEAMVRGVDDPESFGLRRAREYLTDLVDGTNSSCVEWIAASGTGAIRSTIDDALNDGSCGERWVR